jgi:hypothetical protein
MRRAGNRAARSCGPWPGTIPHDTLDAHRLDTVFDETELMAYFLQRARTAFHDTLSRRLARIAAAL